MIKKYLKNFLGEFLIILGTGLFFYNVFNFSHEGGHGGATSGAGGIRSEILKEVLGSSNGDGIEFVAYYYNQETLILITLGAVLAVTGILFIKNFEKWVKLERKKKK